MTPSSNGLLSIRSDRYTRSGIETAMKSAVVLLSVLAVCGPLRMPLAIPAEPKAVAFTGVTVIDPYSSLPAAGMTVVTSAGLIVEVGKAGKAKIPAGTLVVDAGGKYMIPGLWDMHVHLDCAGEAVGPALLAFGVTSVRDCGSPFAVLDRWRARIAGGFLAGPRIKGAGAIFESPRFLEMTGRIADSLEHSMGRILRKTNESRISVASAGEAEAQVDVLKAKGADFVKVRNAASPEILYALAEAAKRNGLPLAGHVIPGVDLAKASEAGQRSFEHDEGFFDANPAPVGSEAQAALAARLVRNRTVIVPTILNERLRLAKDGEAIAVLNDGTGRLERRRKLISAQLEEFWRIQIALKKYDDSPAEGWQPSIEKAKNFVRAMRKGGVDILPGTDLAVLLVYPGASLIDELGIFVDQIGMSPQEALRSATILPARWFGILGDLGLVAKGMLADLVLLDANPLENINNLRSVWGVVAAGRYYDRAELDRLLATVSTHSGDGSRP
jgi:imidazolonepropionase-like amidohydrolase